jgi:hypothetical protein
MVNRVFVLVLVLLAAGAAAAQAAAPSRSIASVQSVDYRVALQATRTSAGAAPTARVLVQVEARRGGTWRTVVLRRLPGTYFWKTVTGPHAVCRLQLADAGTRRVTVQLLETPSIGCAPPHTIPLPAG